MLYKRKASGYMVVNVKHYAPIAILIFIVVTLITVFTTSKAEVKGTVIYLPPYEDQDVRSYGIYAGDWP